MTLDELYTAIEQMEEDMAKWRRTIPHSEAEVLGQLETWECRLSNLWEGYEAE